MIPFKKRSPVFGTPPQGRQSLWKQAWGPSWGAALAAGAMDSAIGRQTPRHEEGAEWEQDRSRGGAPTWQGVCLLVSTSPSGDRVSDNEGSFQPLGLYTRQESKQNPKLSARVTNSSQLAQNFPDFSLPGPPLVLGKPRCLLALFLGTCTDSPHLRRSCTRQICRRGASRIPR